jgi:hypothetical protein
VELPGRTMCVKGALAQLKVAREWLAPVSRNRVEYNWLQFAGAVSPNQVPRVPAYDGEAGLFALVFLPPDRYPVWRAQLPGGHVDTAAARAVGDLLGRLHSAIAADPLCPAADPRLRVPPRSGRGAPGDVPDVDPSTPPAATSTWMCSRSRLPMPPWLGNSGSGALRRSWS